MKHRITIFTIVAVLLATPMLVSGCNDSDADVAAHNISVAAEQFEINRRIIFFNGITDKYLFVIEGRCSVETGQSGLAGALEVTCKIGPKRFRKVFLGLSDNVSYMVQQRGDIDVGTSHYRVIFKPEAIVPNFDRP